MTVLAHRLIAAAITIAAPLHSPCRVGWQSAENAGIDGQCGQPVVGEEHGLAAAGGAGDELVLGTGFIQDLQALLTYRVQTGENAWPLSCKVVGVSTGGAVQWFARHHRA